MVNGCALPFWPGLGINLLHGTGDPQVVISALRAPNLGAVTHPRGRLFRQFAESVGGDLLALAACFEGSFSPVTPAMLVEIATPLMVVVGTADEIAGNGAELAALIPSARHLDLPGRDHMRAVGDRRYMTEVLAFWDALAPGGPS